MFQVGEAEASGDDGAALLSHADLQPGGEAVADQPLGGGLKGVRAGDGRGGRLLGLGRRCGCRKQGRHGGASSRDGQQAHRASLWARRALSQRQKHSRKVATTARPVS